MTNLIPTAEPFFIPGGRTGCLMVHGFTGTPKEMRPMGAYLAERGHSVIGVRLSGHATRIEDMMRTRWQDWVASVEDGWHLLSGICDEVFVIGLSMGGALSLLFGAQFPVAGIVSMSAPYELPVSKLLRMMLPLGKALSLVMRYQDKPPENWFKPERAEEHIFYPRDPVRPGVELDLLLRHMRAGLASISAPTLLMHSHDDLYVPPDHMPRIFAELGSEQKEMFWVKNASHPITVDGERELVFAKAAAFIDRVKQA